MPGPTHLGEIAKATLKPLLEREAGRPRALELGQLEVAVAADEHDRALTLPG
jgi:hypothetical protein